MKNISISIIIVYYKVEKELLKCINSIVSSKTNLIYEIIVVDNDEKKSIKMRLKNKFPKVIYVKSLGNIGYGSGNNLGAKIARGKYLFFLNPDAIIYNYALDKLFDGFSNSEVAIVGPQLLNKGKIMPQGTSTLGTIQGIVALSFINKFFPKNNVSRKYFLDGIDKTKPYEVDTVAGTAFLIRKDIFFRVNGFDENFFLYFEEFDLCKRIRDIGYKIIVIPEAKVEHVWGASTKKSRLNIKNIFKKSRFYYFKKHYGVFSAMIVTLFVSFGKMQLLMTVIFAIGAFLRFYKLEDTLPFIGDHGWFYLSARDMILNGEIPLVGITSSHIWLHQGAFWTYVLAGALWIFKFNPFSGGIVTSTIGIFTIFLVYKVGKEFFSEKVGLISSFLYATSHLVIVHARTPYHTSAIPFFTLLLIFAVYKWLKGNKIFFSFSILFLQVLYNFELATQVLWLSFLSILGYGILLKKPWALDLFNKKTVIASFLSFIVPMLPILIYDLTHGFSQTVKFMLWIPYRVLSQLGIFVPMAQEKESLNSLILLFRINYQQLVFQSGAFISLAILVISLGNICNYFYNVYKKKHAFSLPFNLLFIFIIIPLLGFIFVRTPSEAYLPILFPTLIILTGWAFNKMMERRMLVVPAIIFIIFVGIVNFFTFISSVDKDSSYLKRMEAARRIVKESEGKDYNLIGEGKGSQFQSFTLNYEYLTWWLGKAPSQKEKKLKFFISETEKGIKIEKKIIR